MFYGHLVYFSWPIGAFFLVLVHILYQGKPGNPATMDKKGKKGLK
jgi:hypothetical protein